MSGDKAEQGSLVEDPAVTHFRKYLQVNTMQPNPDYDAAIDFLRNSAQDIGLDFKTHEAMPGKPMVIMTWVGTDPSLSAVMLHSHMDVVPVFPEHWKVDPFSADKMENGDIIARGSQDMKCVGIQYLEAIRRLKKAGKTFLRTIHVTFSSDEEIGSIPMENFVQQDEFKKLNVGFSLDEGLANPGTAYRVFYGERSIWWVKIICPGQPGHGSQFIKDTAGEKIRKVINQFLEFRDSEEKRLLENPSLYLGDVHTVNLTLLEGGIQANVLPAELSATFDIRVPPKTDFEALEKQIESWCKNAGPDVKYEFFLKGSDKAITSTDKSDPWWSAFSTACNELGLELQLEIFPAGTDGRKTRSVGIPVIGFSPMVNTPILLHDHNEFLNEKVFLDGIDIYSAIIPALANVSK